MRDAVAITLRGASRKYNVPLTTLRNWRRYGFLRTIAEPEKRGQPLTVNEADVRDCVQVYQSNIARWSGLPLRGRNARWYMETGLRRLKEGRQEALPEA